LPLESEIESAVVKEAKAHGWKARKHTSPNRRAASDHIFIKEGRVVFIEFKRPGEKASKAQLKEYHSLIDHGADAHILDSVREALKVLKCL
jgi:hypothetical protein